MQLSHKERVRRAIYRMPLDHFPSQVDFTPRYVPRIARHLGVAEQELDLAVDNHLVYAYSLSSAEEYMHNPPVLRRAIELGLARLDQAAGIVYDAWQVGWDLTSEGVWPKVHPLADMESYRHYRFPDPEADGLMDYVEETVQQYGDEYFVLAFQHISLFERSWALRGYNNLMMDMAMNRPFVEELYDRIAHYQAAVALRFIKAGVDGVRVGDDYGTQKGMMMAPHTWREILKPRLQRIWAAYQEAGLPVFQHSCGDVRAILDDFVEMKLNVLHPVQPLAMPLDYLQECYGKALTFFGGIDTQQLLPFGSPEDVRRSVEQCIETLGRNGGYIIAPSQEVMADVPLQNVDALLDAIKEYRSRVPFRITG
jgi:uroporphyrinogen decarboxylase